jgi:AraC-like DNA-binding protein
MQLTFTTYSNSQQRLLSYLDEFKSTKYYEHRTNEIKEDWYTGKLQEIWFEGICIYHLIISPADAIALSMITHKFYCYFCFIYNGSIQIDYQGNTIIYNKGDYFLSPAEVLDLKFTSAAGVYVIGLTKQFLLKVTAEADLKTDFNNAITKNMIIKVAVKELINLVSKAGQPTYIKRMQIELKLLEIIASIFNNQKQQISLRGFSNDDVERLNEAKDIVSAHLQSPFSLTELARKTGLNDFKLKKGFKLLFGNTVFGFLFDLRMDTAYALLQTHKSVNEVAEIVGYKNAHHFTAAFKKKYNMLPSRVSKQLWQ